MVQFNCISYLSWKIIHNIIDGAPRSFRLKTFLNSGEVCCKALDKKISVYYTFNIYQNIFYIAVVFLKSWPGLFQLFWRHEAIVPKLHGYRIPRSEMIYTPFVLPPEVLKLAIFFPIKLVKRLFLECLSVDSGMHISFLLWLSVLCEIRRVLRK